MYQKFPEVWKFLFCQLSRYFYFLHEFAVEKLTNDKDTEIYYTDYLKLKFISLIKKKNIMGTQFHPERSGKNGYNLIKEFFANYEKIWTFNIW